MGIIKYSYHIEIDEGTLAFERFITHLKFFVNRILLDNAYPVEDEEHVQSMIKRFPK